MVSTNKNDAYLYVEGSNDQHVIWALCLKHEIPKGTFVVEKTDSWQKLRTTFEIQLKGDATKIMGLVVDADEDPQKRWQDLIRIISKANLGYDIPSNPVIGGTIFSTADADKPRIGIWLMPDNQTKGDLEDFMRLLIPENDPLIPYAETVLDSIEQADLKRYEKRSKAFLSTWLAWQKRPLPMGQAITEKALVGDSPTAQQFIVWLNNLFIHM